MPYNIPRSFKFNSEYRLLRVDGFENVLHSSNVADRVFKIFFVRNNKGNARLGIISSKKILPRAIDRNRLKRQIRETFRKHSIKACNVDVVVMPRPAYTNEKTTSNEGLAYQLHQVENRCA